MKPYLDLLRHILDNGTDQHNRRTGVTCRAIAGCQLQFDLADGFPAVTTKKLAFNAMKGELLGFFRGYTSAADFRRLGCKIWDANANTTPAWLANPARQGEDDLGRIYSAQWTDWPVVRETPLNNPDAYGAMMEAGFELIGEGNENFIWRKSINQLERALTLLLTDPSDRRIIVSGWNVGDIDVAALPACHMDYRFIPLDDGNGLRLHCVMTIRSWDVFLGGPFNIAETALFLSIMARLAGMAPGVVTIQAANAHLYETHFDAVRQQLGNEPLPLPSLVLSSDIATVTPDAVKGVFERIAPDAIRLEGYRSHEAIPAPMAA